ncbi:hypothetical protein BAUCODRAFT_577462 [Baudoinia panamericana UAMH 10762]|uniref:Uncharacterized protein n=1 Tax=Baudoinia panamericana (strain UAMH 10762) TaxID=717646 RepID=M2LP23_BAUPA|nr:uncharacterized protein BAUCODRAFT_577462 [Baudoinia panamericana UAMH 10762]EMC96122.1 hypothetical protein BAUCODRAFT_577462 [Baudoinia panamericana UAMH 10762]
MAGPSVHTTDLENASARAHVLGSSIKDRSESVEEAATPAGATDFDTETTYVVGRIKPTKDLQRVEKAESVHIKRIGVAGHTNRTNRADGPGTVSETINDHANRSALVGEMTDETEHLLRKRFAPVRGQSAKAEEIQDEDDHLRCCNLIVDLCKMTRSCFDL